MYGLDILGAKSTLTSEPRSAGTSWYSENKVVIWIAGILAAGVAGFLIYDHFATGYRFGYTPDTTPRGWKTGVGWKSEAHRIAADQEERVAVAKAQVALAKELAPYYAARRAASLKSSRKRITKRTRRK
jgi:hypothetical protein